MSKISNTLSLLKLLESGNVIQIKKLAETLECSERSVRTYKEDLEKAGIYIESIPGRYGGYYYISNKEKNYFNIDLMDLNTLENAYLYLLKNNYDNINLLDSLIDKMRYLAIKNKEYLNHNDNKSANNDNYAYIYNSINKGADINFIYKNEKISFKPQNIYVHNNVFFATGINNNINQIRTYNLFDITIIK